MDMTTPTIRPEDREPTTIAPTDSYHRADPVWVYRTGTWRAGIIEAANPRAATVTYRINNSGGGTGVDTLTARYVIPRRESDVLLDS
jgi:hypothetical protein